MGPNTGKCEMDVCGNYKCECIMCQDEDDDDASAHIEDEKAVKYSTMKLKAENERLKKSVICIVCKEKQVQSLSLPCRHVNMCFPCADIATHCPSCGERILGIVRIYLV